VALTRSAINHIQAVGSLGLRHPPWPIR